MPFIGHGSAPKLQVSILCLARECRVELVRLFCA